MKTRRPAYISLIKRSVIISKFGRSYIWTSIGHNADIRQIRTMMFCPVGFGLGPTFEKRRAQPRKETKNGGLARSRGKVISIVIFLNRHSTRGDVGVMMRVAMNQQRGRTPRRSYRRSGSHRCRGPSLERHPSANSREAVQLARLHEAAVLTVSTVAKQPRTEIFRARRLWPSPWRLSPLSRLSSSPSWRRRPARRRPARRRPSRRRTSRRQTSRRLPARRQPAR